MLLGHRNNRLTQAKAIHLETEKKSYAFEDGLGSQPARLHQWSSYELETRRSRSPQKNTRTTWVATANQPLASNDEGFRYLRDDSATTRSQTPAGRPRRWNASFLNRTAANVDNYANYDFSRPAATRDLGGRGRNGKMLARLKVDFDNDSPARGVQSDNFAMQAWTRVRLSKGKFYKVTSDSNDGTRFFFTDSRNDNTLTTLDGDWRNNSSREWSQLVYVPESGRYNFFVQHYDRSGDALVNISLEEVQATGQTRNVTNLRREPSTVGNTPITQLRSGESLKILRQVQSRNDANNRDWYEVETRDGQRGYVATNLVRVEGGLAVLGQPGNNNGPIFPNPGGNGASSGDGIVKGSSIALRDSASTSARLLGEMGNNSRVKILEKVAGGSYGSFSSPDGDIYDQWYKVKTSSGQTGYVAAYFVDFETVGSTFSTALSRNSTVYREHFNEAQKYKSIVESAARPYSSWLKPSLVAAIGSRESGWGVLLSPFGPGGTGDGGFGRGLMQIDSQFHPEFTSSNRWKDPAENIRYALDNVLSDYYDYLSRNTNLRGFELLRGAVAAYNAGPGNVVAAINQGLDVDYYTTGKNYSRDVMQRAGWFQLNGWA
jgi:hypothetical protein